MHSLECMDPYLPTGIFLLRLGMPWNSAIRRKRSEFSTFPTTLTTLLVTKLTTCSKNRCLLEPFDVHQGIGPSKQHTQKPALNHPAYKGTTITMVQKPTPLEDR